MLDIIFTFKSNWLTKPAVYIEPQCLQFMLILRVTEPCVFPLGRNRNVISFVKLAPDLWLLLCCQFWFLIVVIIYSCASSHFDYSAKARVWTPKMITIYIACSIRYILFFFPSSTHDAIQLHFRFASQILGFYFNNTFVSLGRGFSLTCPYFRKSTSILLEKGSYESLWWTYIFHTTLEIYLNSQSHCKHTCFAMI